MFYLMFEGTVFPFGLFSNYYKVKIIMSSFVSLQALHFDNIRKQIKFSPESRQKFILFKNTHLPIILT